MNINECLINKFVRSLLENQSSYMLNFENRVGYRPDENNYNLLTEKEKYTAGISQILTNFISTIEQLEFIKIFIRRTPYKKYLWNNSIDELKYIQYHLEVLFHKIHTILEIMKLLLNEVYILNFNEKNCTWQNLVSQLGTEIQPMVILNNYFTTFKNIIELRHLNSHRGFYLDQEQEEIDLYTGYGLLKLYNNSGIEPDEEFNSRVSQQKIKEQISLFRKRKINIINNIQAKISEYSNDFLESLYEKYNEYYNSLSSN